MDELSFEIKTEEFEGPFDLLLLFIEREELDIHTISLSKITNDFLSYIQTMQKLNMEIASEFIFVAATLMRIKVRTLLPKPTADEEESEISSQEDLIQKLIIYKQFKIASEELRELENKRWQLCSRGNIEYDLALSRNKNDYADELASLNLYHLMNAYEKVMATYLSPKKEEVKHTVIQYPYTIEQQKRVIASLLEMNKEIDFYKILQNSENRIQFVYSFLAILEMLNQQILQLELGLGYNNFSISNKNR